MLDIYKATATEEAITNMKKFGLTICKDPYRYIFGNPFNKSGIYADNFQWNASHLSDLYGLLHTLIYEGNSFDIYESKLFTEEERVLIREASEVIRKKGMLLKAVEGSVDDKVNYIKEN